MPDPKIQINEPPETIHPDLDPDNADWIRGLVAFPWPSKKALMKWLNDNGKSVAWFKTLPVFKKNVDRISWLQKL